MLIGWIAPALVLAISCEGARPSASAESESTPGQPGPSAATDAGATAELDASADGSAEVTSMLAQLADAIDTNLASYSEVDRADLDDLLALALVRAESPGGRGAESAQCASRAMADGFSDAQSAALCQDVRYDSAACADRALRVLGFDRDASVALCAGRGSTETADCAFGVLINFGLSRSQAVAVCSDRDGADVAQCVAPALAAGFDRQQTAALCARRGGASTAACASAALLNFGFTRDEAVALCANRGAPETATCAGNAVSTTGLSREQAVGLCSNRGQATNATCAKSVLGLGFAPEDIVKACRRPPTTLVP